MKRDENASLHLSKEESDAFELRQDIIDLRAEYQGTNQEHGRDSPLTRQVLNKLYHRLTLLSEMAVVEKRRHYFDEADKLRALGRDVREVFLDSGNEVDFKNRRKFLTEIGLECISNFMHRDDLGAQPRAQKFVNMLFEFLAYSFANADGMFRDILEEAGGEPSASLGPTIDL